MPIANDLPMVLETTEPERLATGFIFTEGPLWHPDGYWYFVDLRRNQLLRLTHLIHQEAEGEWRFSRDSRKRSCTRRLFHRWDLVSAAGAGGVSGRVWRGDSGPVAYGAAGISPAAMWRIRGASGQAAAKASRTREAVSMTRVPSFKRRSRRVANSAVASACALGIASRTVRISQYAAVCRIRRIWLASGLRQLVRSEAS